MNYESFGTPPVDSEANKSQEIQAAEELSLEQQTEVDKVVETEKNKQLFADAQEKYVADKVNPIKQDIATLEVGNALAGNSEIDTSTEFSDEAIKEKHKDLAKAEALGERLERVNADQVNEDIDSFLNENKNGTENNPLEPGRNASERKPENENWKRDLSEASPEDRAEIIEAVKSEAKSRIESLFEGDYVGRTEKRKMLNDQTEKFLTLVEKAIAEKSISNYSNGDLLDQVLGNIDLMAFQDKKAVESSLGDHGVRHITENIQRCDQVLEGLADEGKTINAMDQLIAHQAMIMHDVGYATRDVARVDEKGKMADDKGHNVLSSKVAAENLSNPDSPIAKMFSGEDARILHESILYHDSSKVDFDMNDQLSTEESRKSRVESAVHLADNLHAFETKLPEVLYKIPATLESMLLMKSAAETGDFDGVDAIKAQLCEKIDEQDQLAPEDKEALKKAVSTLNGGSYNFNVGRMCGTNPEISFKDGAVQIDVEESAIHQEAIGVFGIEGYPQFKKWLADLSGMDKDDPAIQKALDDGYFEGNGLKISLKTEKGADKTEVKAEKTTFEKEVEKIITDPELSKFAKYDLDRSDKIKNINKKVSKGKIDPVKAQAQISKYTIQRTQARNNFINNRNNGANNDSKAA